MCVVLTMIEDKRKEMLDISNKHGLSALETIKCSQELDVLLNIYQNRRHIA